MKHTDIGWRGAFEPDMVICFLCGECSQWIPLKDKEADCPMGKKLKLVFEVTLDK